MILRFILYSKESFINNNLRRLDNVEFNYKINDIRKIIYRRQFRIIGVFIL